MTRRILPVVCLLCLTIRSVLAFTPKHVPFRIPTQVGASPASIQQRLVQYGLAWPQTQVASNVTRVPGCVATVYIQASIHHNDDNNNDNGEGKVHIVGNADAMVSRGLLSLLAEFLSHKTLEETLALDPTQLTTTLGLTSALSPGRNDGMANMLRVVQQQLRGETTATTTTSATSTTTKDEVASTRTSGNTNNKSSKPTVALLLSGGVDSSVALRLLQQDGYDVTAFYLKIWLEDELSHLGECPWEDDVKMCQQVCDQAGVPLQILSLQDDYQERVMQHVLAEAAAGRTPNPDILCNSRIKFGCFLESIDAHKYDFVASGHYAQVIRSFQNNSKEEEDGTTTTTTTNANTKVKLVRAPDPIKDQSYFLCALDQSQLQRILFPIGHLEKFQVRQLANHFELPNRHRPDSQGLCFLGKIKFRDFLELHLGTREGEIVDAFTGERIGRHDGVWYHTVGQRKGIGKSLFPLATSRGPWYVVAKDPTNNIVYASNQYEEEAFAQARSEFHVENIHWIAGYPPSVDRSHRFWLKIRHGPRLVQGTLDLGSNNEEGVITLDDKDGGLAPGQYAVFYNDEAECLGGGIISERHWAKFLLDSHDRSQSVPTSL